MVSTRGGAKKAQEVAPAAANTLKAPPKRGRKKAVAQEAATELAPATTTVAKITKTTAAKRKAAVAEPEGAEMPVLKKSVVMEPATTSTTKRAANVETKAKPKPAPKRAVRGKKATESAAVEEPAVIEGAPEEAPKPATRTRQAPVKKASAKKVKPAAPVEETIAVAEPAVEEAVIEEPAVEDASKPVARGRNAPAKKIAAVKTVKASISKATAPRTTRARKAAAPKLESAASGVIKTRNARTRKVAVLPKGSPLKKPARKPTTKKAAATLVKRESTPILAAPKAMDESPESTLGSAHVEAATIIVERESTSVERERTPILAAPEAMDESPDNNPGPGHVEAAIIVERESTPAERQTTPVSSIEAAIEQISSPLHAAIEHVSSPIEPVMDRVSPPVQAAIEQVSSPMQAAIEHVASPIQAAIEHVSSPIETVMERVSSPIQAVSEHSFSPIRTAFEPFSDEQTPGRQALAELPNYPQTPAHIKAPISVKAAMAEMTGYINTSSQKQPIEQRTTPIVWGVTDQEAFAELPEYPQTPAHIMAPLSSKDALAQLPDYPKTPAHIVAPLSSKDALAELPSYPNTPAAALEAALQEEISADASEIIESDDAMDIDTDVPACAATPEIELAPLQPAPVREATPELKVAPMWLAPATTIPDVASPVKSALRSPQKLDAKTPKKAVTWNEYYDPEDDFMGYGNPLRGMTFLLDVHSNGSGQNFMFHSLLEEYGAKVVTLWEDNNITHVLYKDGRKDTIQKVIDSNGAIKCVNIGYALDCEAKKTRLDETAYLVDLDAALSRTPVPLKPSRRMFTPARTPSKYKLDCGDIPTTPTSSEIDHTLTSIDDDKENSDMGSERSDCPFRDTRYDFANMLTRTCPTKASSTLMRRSPMKTPSKPSTLANQAIKAWSTGKRSYEDTSLAGISSSPAKKLRFS
jgi:hypothetical protein